MRHLLIDAGTTPDVTSMESPLHGGNISQVVRVGTTVRRHQGPWSGAVHGLLPHLEAQRFDGAPRFLGIDDQDWESLSFLPGEVGNYPLQPSMWSDTALIEAGRLLRRLHDATVGYAPPDAPWQQVYPERSHHEVICHNDAAPNNMVFVNGEPRAFIDFDTAGPGPRIWDVAYTFVPLAQFVPLPDGTTVPYEAIRHAENRRRRLRLLSDSYGLERAISCWSWSGDCTPCAKHWLTEPLKGTLFTSAGSMRVIWRTIRQRSPSSGSTVPVGRQDRTDGCPDGGSQSFETSLALSNQEADLSSSVVALGMRRLLTVPDQEQTPAQGPDSRILVPGSPYRPRPTSGLRTSGIAASVRTP